MDFNSQVKAGQVVAQIDPALFHATLTRAEGDLASAQAALELAKMNATRTQELFAQEKLPLKPIWIRQWQIFIRPRQT